MKGLYGVVVLYNPNIESLIFNIRSYVKDLEKLYLIDNSENSNYKLLKNYILEKKNIEYVWLRENKGIAEALNIGKEKAIRNKAKYLLTMDQDSYFENNFFKMVDYLENNDLRVIAILSPFHNLGKMTKGKDRASIEEKERVMTSGNILNLDLVKKIGDFNEDFFIDEVDHDFCYRVRRSGYKILVLNYVSLKHNLGSLKKFPFFSITNHNYIRRYYITRNRCYMMKKYEIFRKKYIFLLISDFFKILIFEKDKLRKIKFFLKGINDFFKNKSGKLE